MKGQLHNILYAFILLSMALLLQSCGSSSDDRVFSISADTSSASFSNEVAQESSDSVAIKVNFVGDGILVGFPPETSPVPWLTYRAENVTDSSATIHLEVINANRLPPDSYQTKIRIATTNDNASKFAETEINISLLVWQLTTDTNKLNYTATLGDSEVASQTIAITSENNNWLASTDADWLTLDTHSGSGDGVITVSASPTGFVESGVQSAKVILTEATSGDSKTIDVDLALDNIYFYTDKPSIALSKTMNVSSLDETITIKNVGENQYPWQAATDAPWLTLTPISATQLRIQADSDIAASNAISHAEINISAADDMAVMAQTIQVSLFNSEQEFNNQVLEPLNVADDAMVSSPNMPYFYIAHEHNLLTYHQYSGELIATLAVSPENSLLEQLIIHPTGEYLLAKALVTTTAENGSTKETIHRYRITLADNSIIEITDANIQYEPLAIIPISGRYYVVTQTLEFADENLQRLYWDNANAFFTNNVEVAKQANTLYALNGNTGTFNRYNLQANDFGELALTTQLTHEYRPESLEEGQAIRSFIVSNDESQLYLISDNSEWLSFDGTSFTDNGLLESNDNVVTLFLEKNHNDEPHFLRIDPTVVGGFYLDKYDNNQNIQSTTYTQGQQPSSIRLTSDAQRLIVNANNQATPEIEGRVELVTIEP